MSALSGQIAYLDSSVLLRIILGEPEPIKDLADYKAVYSSRLLQIESLRVLNRLLLSGQFDESGYSHASQRLKFLIQGLHIVQLNEIILRRAEQPLPVALGTLDALHLVTALVVQEQLELSGMSVLTHDQRLGRCASLLGLTVIG